MSCRIMLRCVEIEDTDNFINLCMEIEDAC